MKHLLLHILILWFLLIPKAIYAQQNPITEQEIRNELMARGIDEQVLRDTLSKEGIEFDQLENLSPTQIKKLQLIIADLEQKSLVTPQLTEDLPTEVNNISSSLMPQKDSIPVLPEEPKDTLTNLKVLEPDIYGRSLFMSQNAQVFQQSRFTKVPDSYILGPGDEISISIFGDSQLEKKYEVREDGYIRIIDGRQRVLMKGVSLGSAKDKLYRIYSNYFRFNRGEFEVTLNFSRTIELGIYGEIENPGSYSIDAVNTVFNALVAAGGPTETGSLRNIKLNKAGGKTNVFDVYKFMSDPISDNLFFIEDNDILFVPLQGKVVKFSGAVRRPMRFELLEDENLLDALLYAGGLTREAFRSTFKLERYIDNQRIVLDIPYTDLLASGGDFNLIDGDEIFVDSISLDLHKFVQVRGEVENSGDFEYHPNLRASEVLSKAVLKTTSRMDLAPLLRQNSDSTIQFIFLDLQKIAENPGGSEDLILQSGDQIVVWSQSRFSDQMTIRVEGAVREPDDFPYDNSQNVRIREAILLAGGLQRDASHIGIIHRVDPLRPNYKEYIHVDLQALDQNPGSPQNIPLQAFDVLEILSENFFSEETYISVSGAVNNPGEFQYGKDMTIREALILARGFRLAAATNTIEVSRIIIKDNEPTKTVIANLSINRDFENDTSVDANYILQPYDNVIVRFVPEFEMQKTVEITGEVQFPGPYSIIRENEKILSLITRAGGLTVEAFPAGARIYRQEDGIGFIVMRLDEVIKDENSRYNFILKDGDRIDIPKQQDFVWIRGATRVEEVIDASLIDESQEIKVAFHKGKNAKFYIDYYAGGMAENAEKKLIFVRHPNGEIKQTKRKFPFGWKYPEVQKGSVITVGTKPLPSLIEGEEKEKVDWTKVLGDSVAQAMSILTLILLVQSLD